ncbi:hypothetical protein Tco_0162655 [Tanacetum coccineum]
MNVEGGHVQRVAREGTHVESVKLKRELEAAEISNTLLHMGREQTERELYRLRDWTYDFNKEMVQAGVVIKSPPSNSRLPCLCPIQSFYPVIETSLPQTYTSSTDFWAYVGERQRNIDSKWRFRANQSPKMFREAEDSFLLFPNTLFSIVGLLKYKASSVSSLWNNKEKKFEDIEENRMSNLVSNHPEVGKWPFPLVVVNCGACDNVFLDCCHDDIALSGARSLVSLIEIKCSNISFSSATSDETCWVAELVLTLETMCALAS